MKTIRITIDDDLLERVDRAARKLGVSRPRFVQRALPLALKRIEEETLDSRHREGYLRHPVTRGEFDLWQREQVWPDW